MSPKTIKKPQSRQFRFWMKNSIPNPTEEKRTVCHDSTLIVLEGKYGVIEVVVAVVIVVRSFRFIFFLPLWLLLFLLHLTYCLPTIKMRNVQMKFMQWLDGCVLCILYNNDNRINFPTLFSG